MKTLTKVMTGVSIAALSVMVAGGMKAEAASSSGPFTADKTLTGIESGSMVSYDAVKDKKGALSWNAKAKWDVYYTNTDVDLSNLKTAKDTYVTVKTVDKKGEAAYAVYKIEKDTITKFKGSIGADKSLTIEEGKAKTKVTGAGLVNYEYRTATGAWKAITENKGEIDFSITPYEQQGTTLYFRYKGKEISPASSDTTVADAPEGTTVQTVAADSFVGKEFKVKVAKMANAPAINVDYNKGIIKKNAKAQSRVGDSFTSVDEDWADFSADYVPDSSAAGTFQMRIKATDKKAASKIAVYSWKEVAAPSITSNVDSKTGDLLADKGDLIANELTYEAKEVEAAKAAKATFEIKNTTTKETAKTFVIYKAKVDGKNIVKADEKAVATVKQGKSFKFTAAKFKDDDIFIVQYAGDKAKDVLPSGTSETAITVKFNVKAAAEE